MPALGRREEEITLLSDAVDLPVWLAGAVGVLDLLIRVGALVVPRNREPEPAPAWLLTTQVAPVLGALAHLVDGDPELPEQQRDAQARMDGTIAAVVEDERSDLLATDLGPSWVGRAERLGQALGAMTFWVLSPDGTAAVGTRPRAGPHRPRPHGRGLLAPREP